MDHAYVEERGLVALYRTGRLDPEEEQRFEEHFFGCAARVMGQIMIDAARRARVSGRAIPKLAARAAAASDQNPGNSNQGFDTEAFEQALGDLEAQDAQAAEIFRLRVFLGLTAAECAMAIGVSERTVFREWQLSCAYLAERIEK